MRRSLCSSAARRCNCGLYSLAVQRPAVSRLGEGSGLVPAQSQNCARPGAFPLPVCVSGYSASFPKDLLAVDSGVIKNQRGSLSCVNLSCSSRFLPSRSPVVSAAMAITMVTATAASRSTRQRCAPLVARQPAHWLLAQPAARKLRARSSALSPAVAPASQPTTATDLNTASRQPAGMQNDQPGRVKFHAESGSSGHNDREALFVVPPPGPGRDEGERCSRRS